MVEFAEMVLMELEGMLHDFGGSKVSSLGVTVLVFCCNGWSDGCQVSVR